MAIFGYIFNPVVRMGEWGVSLSVLRGVRSGLHWFCVSFGGGEVLSLFVGERLVVPAIPSVLEFFPVGGDASRVVWAHAVNNVSLLESALNGMLKG